MYTLVNAANTVIVAALVLFSSITIRPCWTIDSKFSCSALLKSFDTGTFDGPLDLEYYRNVDTIHHQLRKRYEPELKSVADACKAALSKHKDKAAHESRIDRLMETKLSSWSTTIEMAKQSVDLTIRFCKENAEVYLMNQLRVNCAADAVKMWLDIAEFDQQLREELHCGPAYDGFEENWTTAIVAHTGKAASKSTEDDILKKASENLKTERVNIIDSADKAIVDSWILYQKHTKHTTAISNSKRMRYYSGRSILLLINYVQRYYSTRD